MDDVSDNVGDANESIASFSLADAPPAALPSFVPVLHLHPSSPAPSEEEEEGDDDVAAASDDDAGNDQEEGGDANVEDSSPTPDYAMVRDRVQRVNAALRRPFASVPRPEWVCPLTGEIMVDPVVNITGRSYERLANHSLLVPLFVSLD